MVCVVGDVYGVCGWVMCMVCVVGDVYGVCGG